MTYTHTYRRCCSRLGYTIQQTACQFVKSEETSDKQAGIARWYDIRCVHIYTGKLRYALKRRPNSILRFIVTWQRANATAPLSQSERRRRNTWQPSLNVYRGRSVYQAVREEGKEEIDLFPRPFFVRPIRRFFFFFTLWRLACHSKNRTKVTFLFLPPDAFPPLCATSEMEYCHVAPSDALIG